MRATELVGRAEQHVAAELTHIDRLVRRVVHRVDPRDRTRGTSERADALRICERPGRVRREREGHDPRAVRELALEVVVVDGQLVGHTRGAHGHSLVGRELDPGRNAPVVIELGGEHLVTGLEVATGRA